VDFLDEEGVDVEHVDAARYTFFGPLASIRTRALMKSNTTQVVAPAKTTYNIISDSNKDHT
jgi:hypothetical protein